MLLVRGMWSTLGFLAIYAMYSIFYRGWALSVGEGGANIIGIAGLLGGSFCAWHFREEIGARLLDVASQLVRVPARVWLFLVIMGGILLRLAWIVLFPAPLLSDGMVQFDIARRLLETDIYMDAKGERAFWAPGYPFLFYSFFLIFGVKEWVPTLLHLVFFAASVLAVWKLSLLVVGRAAARMATLVLMIWPNYITSSGVAGAKELVIVTLFTFAVWLYLRERMGAMSGTVSWLKTAAGGALMGYTALVQPSYMLFPSVLMVLMLLQPREWRRDIMQILFFTVGMALIIVPWSLRNYEVFGEMVSISTNGGDVFYRANNPLATGGFTPEGARKFTGYTELERSKLGYLWGREWMRQDPSGFFKVVWKKQVLFLGDDSSGAYDTLKRDAAYSSPVFVITKGLSNLFWFSFWIVVLGMVFRNFNRSLASHPVILTMVLSFLYLFAIHSLFESSGSHHLPLVGMKSVLVALAIGEPALMRRPEES